MLEDFPLVILQHLICLVGSMGKRVVMQEQQWEVLEHPQYSPYLAPSDFHLFGPLNHHLSTEHFPDDKPVKREVTTWFQQQPKEFYAAGFQGLVKRWDKCLNVQGDYAEK
jgi:histone-lysine N-methyltransferase SETMAR